jgi:hypothetical protein
LLRRFFSKNQENEKFGNCQKILWGGKEIFSQKGVDFLDIYAKKCYVYNGS